MAEDTRIADTKVGQENEALVQEMLRDAQKAGEPGDLITNPVIHKGDASLETPMIVKDITSAGYLWVWDTRTFEKLPVLSYMLPAKLRQRREDGSYRFTTIDPKRHPWRGKIKCMLHSDDLNRKHFDELGFRSCKKENLANEYERRRHMSLKHPKEWEAIEQERRDKERQEDRDLQKAILLNTVRPKDEQKADEIFECDVCGKKVSSRIALAGHKRSHES